MRPQPIIPEPRSRGGGPPGHLPAALGLAFALLTLPALAAAGPPFSPDGVRGKAESLNFLVLGDWGLRGKGCQRPVADAMGRYADREAENFIVSVGDNFYKRGVSGVDDEGWARSFEDIYRASSLHVPWYAALGNHDYRGNVGAQVAYGAAGGRWRMPARYYAFEQSLGERHRALFVFLDTSPFVEKYRRRPGKYPSLEGQDYRVQLEWLQRTLDRSPAEWKLVFGHHTVYSGGDLHGPTRELLDVLPPLFERHGVQAYFSGHEHNLQHLEPPGETHYVVSGGGSQARSASSGEWTSFAAGLCGFVAARLSPREMRLEFFGEDGRHLYKALISRKKGGEEKP